MYILKAWLEDLRRVLRAEPNPVFDIRIGIFYTAAQLETEHVGVAFTPRGLADTVCCPQSAAAAPPAGRMTGMDAWELARYAFSHVPLRRAVGVATLNALSALAMEREGVPGGRLLPDTDALKAITIRPSDRVAMVGAFVPFIKSLRDEVAGLFVIDRHREALKEHELQFWRPPEVAPAVIAQADVVLITGSALIEGDLETLLDAAADARTVALAGPTASPWPPTFFEHGVDVLAGIRIQDGVEMLQLVSEAGSGYFFDSAAEKVSVVREGARSKSSGAAMTAAAGGRTTDDE